ncbi:hypothetical protein BDP27DRAFT_1404662 [Rhodocollybia butyracea]|uniref:Uncharacterized protein n=1 Tax=Rhodocollybia butyracea TaxID=206335 RepID=A0A9P5U3M2_9AGAR|nr:hypothetical protein BDP27DRAFT_1404662 [Rhodocollybia butyracea]
MPPDLSIAELKTILKAVVGLMSSGEEEEDDVEMKTIYDLIEAGISYRSLHWKEGGEASAAQHGLVENNFMSIENTKSMICSGLKHIAETEGGSPMAIDLILLHLASVETDDTQAVITIPETSSKPEFDRKNTMLWNPFGILANREVPRSTFKIFEAKNFFCMQEHHTAEVVLAAAAICKRDELECTRCALTDGTTWMFFTYRQVGSDSGIYGRTPEIKLGENAEGLPLILGLLRDWLNNAQTPESEMNYFNTV